MSQVHNTQVPSTILRYFPYKTPRDGQRELLLALEKIWNQYDVFCIIAPTAFGKSAVARTLLGWKHSSSLLTPSNMLVDQFLQEFPDTPTLARLDSYYCEDWQQSCAATRSRKKGFCKGCHCASALATAKYRRGPGVYNYHTYLAHRLERNTLIVDEAHNLAHTVQDRLAERIWIHDYPTMRSVLEVGQILPAIEKLPPRQRKHKKIEHLYAALTALAPTHVVSMGVEEFNGKGTIRGQPEERRCIKLYPVDIREGAQIYWPGLGRGAQDPSSVNKLILLSATIGAVDTAELGLSGKRIAYLQASHPIPVERRPVQIVPAVYLSHGDVDRQVPKLASEILNISEYHAGEKGVVHATYSLAEKLQPLLGDRFLFHTRDNKREVYERFRNSPTSDARVLVACGMYEGIDLPDDLGRWQVVAKVPWKSLGDPAIRYKAENDPDWYRWQTLRDLIQACGRISRHEEDFGTTYIVDGSVEKLLSSASHLIPRWFSEAITR